MTRDSRLRGPLPDLAPLIEHALLDPHLGLESVQQACDQARHYGFAAVCVSSRWVAAARERLGGAGSVKLVAVVEVIIKVLVCQVQLRVLKELILLLHFQVEQLHLQGEE